MVDSDIKAHLQHCICKCEIKCQKQAHDSEKCSLNWVLFKRILIDMKKCRVTLVL